MCRKEGFTLVLFLLLLMPGRLPAQERVGGCESLLQSGLHAGPMSLDYAFENEFVHDLKSGWRSWWELPVRYFSARLQRRYELFVQNGLLVDYKKRPFNTGKTDYIYVLTSEGALIAAPSKPGRIHHSSLSAGRPVIMAGHIEAQDGSITKINFRSGHYRPTLNQFFAVVHYLRGRGLTVPVASVFETEFRYRHLP